MEVRRTGKPWDDVPETWSQRVRRRVLSTCIYIVSAPVAFLAILIGLLPLILIEEPKSLDARLAGYGVWISTLFLLLLLHRLLGRINRTYRQQMTNGWDVVPPQVTTGIDWFRAFDSQKAIEFGPGYAKIDGKLSGDLRIGYIAVTTSAFFYSFWGLRPGTPTLIGCVVMLGWVATLVYMVAFAIKPRGYDRTVEILEQDIASVSCRGPMITIKLLNPAVPRIRCFRIYPTRISRDRFFRDFNTSFPTHLPVEYRNAAEWEVHSALQGN